MKRGLILPENPVLADKAVAAMQEALAERLAWIDTVFPRAERLAFDDDGRRAYTANVYAGGNEYVNVYPDDAFGNYCFFWLSDPQEVESTRPLAFSAPLSVIFWMDMRTIGGASWRDRETVKRDILEALEASRKPYGQFASERCYELSENVYRGFTIDETSNRFLMQPYFALRVEGTLKYKELCYD